MALYSGNELERDGRGREGEGVLSTVGDTVPMLLGLGLYWGG